MNLLTSQKFIPPSISRFMKQKLCLHVTQTPNPLCFIALPVVWSCSDVSLQRRYRALVVIIYYLVYCCHLAYHFKGNLKCFLKESLALDLCPQPSGMLNIPKLLCEHQVHLNNVGAETNVECLTKRKRKPRKLHLNLTFSICVKNYSCFNLEDTS